LSNHHSTEHFTRLPAHELREMVADYLMREGASKASAVAVAEVIVAAESDGCLSHGLFRLAGYVASLRSKKVNSFPNVRISQPASSLLIADGDKGFCAVALKESRERFIELAQKTGIAGLAIKNAYHFSALWTDIEPLCRAGLVAFAFTSYLPAVAPAGGTKGLFGTNPMAFGWPRHGKPPMIFDQASSVVAKGEVMLAAREGRKLPLGTGLNAAGHPTTDAKEVLEGALLPFGGYKGSSIALMVELLAGPLLGENLSFEAAQEDNKDGGPPRGGEFIFAINSRLLNADAASHGEKLFAELLGQPGTRLPSDRRYRVREANMAAGVPISAEYAAELGLKKASPP
jgi:delta1-piperideine-2-carboxylate reductase